MRHGKQLDKHLFIELHSVYLLGVLSLFLPLLGALRQWAGLEPPFVSKTASLWVKTLFCIVERYKLMGVSQCISRCCIVLSCKIVST